MRFLEGRVRLVYFIYVVDLLRGFSIYFVGLIIVDLKRREKEDSRNFKVVF